jgi:uncharacterized protein (DUF1499 family)
MAVYLIWGLLAALVAFAAYVRLAPSDPARWHVGPDTLMPATSGHLLSVLGTQPEIVTTMNSAGARFEVQGPPRSILARLDEIALATPRTVRLAGSPEKGIITWVTRSAILGFPDYVTAEGSVSDVATSEVTIVSRSRFGRSDFGVNAARLKDWLSRL